MNYDAMANEEARYQENRMLMQGVADNNPKAMKDVKSHIEEDIDDLRSVAEMLHMRLDQHEKKLYPVLQGDFDSAEAGSTPAREDSSHLDNVLRGLLSSVQHATNRLVTLTNRLDI